VSAPRFFVDSDLAIGGHFNLPKGVAHHASNVLRLRDGDAIVLFNGRGGEYHGRLAAHRTQAELISHASVEREAPVAVTLVQAWLSTDKLDWLTEKAVELGAARILLAPSRRSVVQLDGARRAKRLERLRETAIAACSQCGRNRVLPIEAFDDLESALRKATDAGQQGALLLPDAPRSLVELAGHNQRGFAVAVGPEGGFEDAEVLLALRCGFLPVRLGPRVLRTETAGLAALAAFQALAGDFR
jgi:16S rRNA (uracil1498-N3)-methyltransferase